MTFSKLIWHKRTHGHPFTGAEFRVLMSIFDHSDEHGRKSHPGLKLLMEETGYGRSAISEALTALQERGWITQTRKGSGVSKRTSVYELVPDAPNPVSWSGGADQHDESSSTAGADQLPEVGPVERTSWSAGADLVGPLERTPTDPGSDPGSDPFGTDQEEVRYSPNHLGNQDETGSPGRSLAVAGRTGATEYPDPFGSGAKTAAGIEAPAGLVGLRPASAKMSPAAMGGCRHNPFCDNPQNCNCGKLFAS